MIVFEVVKAGLEALAGFVELHQLEIVVLAVAIAGLYYLREIGDLLMLGARGARTAALVGAVVLAVLGVGLWVGVLDLEGGLGGLVEAALSAIHGVIS